MDAEVQPQIQAVVRGEAAREFKHTGRVGRGALDQERVRRSRFEQERRRRHGRADPAEAPPQVPAQVEDAEVQARRR